MPLIKLIAKPATWFKEGTEVLYEDDHYVYRRMTLEEYEDILTDGWAHAVFRGVRIIENPASEGGGEVGQEIEDGELCQLEEFNVEIIPDTHN